MVIDLCLQNNDDLMSDVPFMCLLSLDVIHWEVVFEALMQSGYLFFKEVEHLLLVDHADTLILIWYSSQVDLMQILGDGGEGCLGWGQEVDGHEEGIAFCETGCWGLDDVLVVEDGAVGEEGEPVDCFGCWLPVERGPYFLKWGIMGELCAEQDFCHKMAGLLKMIWTPNTNQQDKSDSIIPYSHCCRWVDLSATSAATIIPPKLSISII